MSYNRTVSEFTTRRKITYGGSNATENRESLSSRSLQQEATISPHKANYSFLDNGDEVYIIEFKIGDFRFDEINIRTEGKRLFVNGQNVVSANNSDELSREFSREFRLPNDVEPSSIKAHLDEKTRELKLTGLVIKETKQNGNSAYASESSTLIGSLKEKKNVSSIDFEIYLGDQLKDGQIIFEVPNLVTLNVRVIKTETDSFGSINLELKREIKLPNGAKLNNINHNIDSSTATLHIQVPLK